MQGFTSAPKELAAKSDFLKTPGKDRINFRISAVSIMAATPDSGNKGHVRKLLGPSSKCNYLSSQVHITKDDILASQGYIPAFVLAKSKGLEAPCEDINA